MAARDCAARRGQDNEFQNHYSEPGTDGNAGSSAVHTRSTSGKPAAAGTDHTTGADDSAGEPVARNHTAGSAAQSHTGARGTTWTAFVAAFSPAVDALNATGTADDSRGSADRAAGKPLAYDYAACDAGRAGFGASGLSCRARHD